MARTNHTEAPGPAITLIPAQNSITVPRYGTTAYMDPGIWVAALGSPLELDVQRVSYAKPISITQVIHLPDGGTQVRPLPRSVLDGWNGLRDFVRMTVRNRDGKVVGRARLPFCPNAGDTERVSPDSPATSPYPQQCSADDPFQKAMVWGVASGWAVDPAEALGTGFRLAFGTYRVTETITPAYAKLFHIPARAATATVKVTVVKAPSGPAARHTTSPQAKPLSSLPSVPYMSNPPATALPDLVALPS